MNFTVVKYANYLDAQAAEITKTRSGRKSMLKLLASGARLLEEKSHVDLVVADICAASKVAKGTFYIYFETKDIFLEKLLEGYVQFEAQTIYHPDPRDTPFGYARGIVSWYEQTFTANSGLLTCLLQLSEWNETFAQLWSRRNRQVVDRVFMAVKRDLVMDEEEVSLLRLVIRSAGAIMDQTLFDRYRLGFDAEGFAADDMEKLIDFHATLLYRAVFGVNPPESEVPSMQRLINMTQRFL